MGVWGWDERQDDMVLEGTIRWDGEPTVADDDKDWCFKVDPDENHLGLLGNPSGDSNWNGVECEVRVSNEFVGHLNSVLAPKMGDRVTVTGTWSLDRSHKYNGEEIYDAEDGDHGKMEIHPVTSVVYESARNETPYYLERTFNIFAASDDSDTTTWRQVLANLGWSAVPFVGAKTVTEAFAKGRFSVPHRQENRIANINIPVENGSTFTVHHLESHVLSGPSFKIEQGPIRSSLVGRIETGVPPDQGFYFAQVRIVTSTIVRGTVLTDAGAPAKGAFVFWRNTLGNLNWNRATVNPDDGSYVSNALLAGFTYVFRAAGPEYDFGNTPPLVDVPHHRGTVILDFVSGPHLDLSAHLRKPPVPFPLGHPVKFAKFETTKVKVPAQDPIVAEATAAWQNYHSTLFNVWASSQFAVEGNGFGTQAKGEFLVRLAGVLDMDGWPVTGASEALDLLQRLKDQKERLGGIKATPPPKPVPHEERLGWAEFVVSMLRYVSEHVSFVEELRSSLGHGAADFLEAAQAHGLPAMREDRPGQVEIVRQLQQHLARYVTFVQGLADNTVQGLDPTRGGPQTRRRMPIWNGLPPTPPGPHSGFYPVPTAQDKANNVISDHEPNPGIFKTKGTSPYPRGSAPPVEGAIVRAKLTLRHVVVEEVEVLTDSNGMAHIPFTAGTHCDAPILTFSVQKNPFNAWFLPSEEEPALFFDPAKDGADPAQPSHEYRLEL